MSTPAARADLSAGADPPVVQGYAFLQKIGQGASGQVWLARHLVSGEWRAVKVVRRSGGEGFGAFERERDGVAHYQNVAAGHPGLVPVLDRFYTDDEQTLYYAMPLADADVAGDPPRSGDLVWNQAKDDAVTDTLFVAVSDGQIAGVVSRESGETQRAKFSADSRFLATGGEGFARIWRVPDLQPAGPQLRFERGLEAIAWSPDGRYLATGGVDGIVRLWDPVHAVELTGGLAHGERLRSVRFSPDGAGILTTSVDGYVRLWRLPVRYDIDAVTHDRVLFQAGQRITDSGRLVNLADGELKILAARLTSDRADH